MMALMMRWVVLIKLDEFLKCERVQSVFKEHHAVQKASQVHLQIMSIAKR
jgi:hypothetical protein